MKQKEIVINSKLSFDAEEMIKEYFAVQTVSDIEGFKFSENEFIHRYQGTYAFNELRTVNYHAVYRVDQCDICLKPYDVIINDRAHLYRYLQATYKLCGSCKILSYSVEKFLSLRLDGDIAF